MDYVTTLCLVVAHMLPYGLPAPYYGKLIGPLQIFDHEVNGTVYAADENTLVIQGFHYDGKGPDAFFWAGTTSSPSPDGFIVPYPENFKGSEPPILTAHSGTDVVLRLPDDKKIWDIRWLSVWCRKFAANFAQVLIPNGIEVPKPRVLPEFKRLAHRLRSGNITVLDTKTFFIPKLYYDGAGPDAYFWVGTGSDPNVNGIKVPNEVNSLEPLKGYQGESIKIVLPGELTVHDINWLGMWCVKFTQNFGHVMIPNDLDVPPALEQARTTASINCKELLKDRLQVQWEVQGDTVTIQLAARITENQYMAFGLSGEEGRTAMVGGDVVVAYYNKVSGAFRAIDYHMSAKAQCDGQKGVCPDGRVGGKDDVTTISGSRVNGVTMVKYSRPLETNDHINDQNITVGREVNVIAATGPLNSRNEANAHSYTDKNNEDILINFSNHNDNTCATSLFDVPDETAVQPWPASIVFGQKVLSARIGPTGGKRGYTPLTGLPSWGIAWYINDLLIPEVYVERGQTYTFTVEGGNSDKNPARYHPFYITDSKEGGYGQKSATEQQKQKVYAGVGFDAKKKPYPTAAGRYCEWEHKTIDRSAESKTFAEYFSTLKLACDEGVPAQLNWTVAADTPDLLYYQCYTHNNLGWKIHVVDKGYKYTLKTSGSGRTTAAGYLAAVHLIVAVFFLR